MKHLLIILILFSVVQANAQVPFTCSGEFYLTLSPGGGANSFFYEVEVDTNSNVIFNQIGNSDIGVYLNGIGYRSTDNLIYGVHPSDMDLYQLDANGNSFFLTALNNPNNYRYFSGDVTPDGQFLVLLGSQNINGFTRLKEVLMIDLTNQNYTQTATILTRASTNLPNDSMAISDIAFDPLTGELYAFDQTYHRLVKIDMQTGVIDDVTYPTTTTADLLGALMFDAFGDLYAYGRLDTIGSQENFYNVDLQTGQCNLMASGPAAFGNDGCSCPYTIQVLKTASKDTIAQCDTFSFELLIANTSGIPQQVNLFDSLSSDFQIVQINHNLNAVVNGVGTNILSFNNVTLPLGFSRVEVKVQTNAATLGNYSSQAKITGLPLSLGSEIYSDNPNTVVTNDATKVTVIPNIEQGSNEIVCTETLSVVPIPGANYLWNNGDSSLTINTDSAGIYFVQVEFFGCTITDTIIIAAPIPIDIGKDTSICEGDFLTIQSNFDSLIYRWNTLDTTRSITIQNAGLYLLEVEDNEGCQGADSILIDYVEADFDLGNDTTICSNASLSIDLSYLNPIAVLWQNQLLSNEILIQDEGQYIVALTDSLGCDFLDSITVFLENPPEEVLTLPSDTTICLNNTLLLNAYEPNATNYLWSGESAFYNQNNIRDSIFLVTYEGTYQVEITNRCGGITHFIEVEKEDCTCEPYIPNGFTPNNDGINDDFQIFFSCDFSDYELMMFDRWGNQVFYSTDNEMSWNGTYQNQILSNGVYVWQLTYSSVDNTGKNTFKTLAGSVTLIR